LQVERALQVAGKRLVAALQKRQYPAELGEPRTELRNGFGQCCGLGRQRFAFSDIEGEPRGKARRDIPFERRNQRMPVGGRKLREGGGAVRVERLEEPDRVIDRFGPPRRTLRQRQVALGVRQRRPEVVGLEIVERGLEPGDAVTEGKALVSFLEQRSE